MSDRWPAHLAERAKIFEIHDDGEPLTGPTRLPLIWDGYEFVELDPDTWGVSCVGRVEVTKESANGSN